MTARKIIQIDPPCHKMDGDRSTDRMMWRRIEWLVDEDGVVTDMKIEPFTPKHWAGGGTPWYFMAMRPALVAAVCWLIEKGRISEQDINEALEWYVRSEDV